MIEIYTDGSCRGNPGPGGWATIIYDSELKIIIDMAFAKSNKTTNNEMELTAILNAFQKIEYFNFPNIEYILYTDSAYCYNILNSWMYNWAKDDWKTVNKKDIKNKDLIINLYNYYITKNLKCQIEKIKGHADNLGNELCDALATDDMKKFLTLIKKNDIIILSEEENIKNKKIKK